MKKTLPLLAILSLTTPALAHNGPRIFLTLENAHLISNLDTFLNGHNITPHVTIFRGTFGADPENPLPNFTQFPGLSGSTTTTPLVTGGSISFDILDSLLYWNGTGNVAFTPAPESLSISSGLNLATTGTGFVPGFTLVPSVPAADGWHTHPGYTLNPAPASATPHDGIYLLQLEFNHNSLSTQPLCLLFNQSLPDSTLTQAVNAIPEPASLAILATALPLLLNRQRKKPQ